MPLSAASAVREERAERKLLADIGRIILGGFCEVEWALSGRKVVKSDTRELL